MTDAHITYYDVDDFLKPAQESLDLMTSPEVARFLGLTDTATVFRLATWNGIHPPKILRASRNHWINGKCAMFWGWSVRRYKATRRVVERYKRTAISGQQLPPIDVVEGATAGGRGLRQ